MKNLDELANEMFLSAMNLAPPERDAYLAKACCGSSDLRARVDSMLELNDRAGSFLMHPVLGTGHEAYGQDPTVTAEVPTPLNAVAHISPQHKPQFKSGDLLFERFFVVRFIARGGMGEVYEVEDRQLRGVHVALKTILSQYATDPIMQGRFEREVLHAREVVHPNVCPIYDIFHWKRTEGDLIFLTMKLLPGETLANRLLRLGTLPPTEVARITRQVTAGLSAAHEAGILHRDIKPANIILGGSGDRMHVYVTDFGLARPFEDNMTTLTVGLAGTPGYVAPELFRGSAPSKASDVFSLGVVIYQMLSGHLPEAGMIPFKNKKSTHLSSEIAQQWRAPLERSLHPDLAVRFKDIPEFAASLPLLEADSYDHKPAFRGISRRTLVVVGASGLVGAAAGGIWFGWDDVINLIEPLPKQRSVALMAWPINKSSAIVTTILDQIGARLLRAESSIENFVVFSTRDLSYGSASVRSPGDAAKILGATLVLAASLYPVNGSYNLELQLLDATTSSKLREHILSFGSREIVSIEGKASDIAARMLSLPRDHKPVQDVEELRKLPEDVLEIYSQARLASEKPNNTGLDTAISLYQKTVELDPRFALGYAELAIVYIRRFLGNGERANVDLAQSNSTLALRYNPNSAKAMLSSALVLLYSGESKAALEAFSKALAADPENPQVLFYEAQAYRYLNQYESAESVYRKINSERPNYWPAYNELGYILSQQGRHDKAADAFRKAIAAAPSVALPEANLGSEYMYLNRIKDAVEACQRSNGKNPNDAAYRTLGDIAFMRGDFRSSKSNYQEAARLNPADHDTWRDIGDCDAMLGNSAGVRENYQQAASALLAAMPTNSESAYAWATLAFYFAKLGEKSKAESALEKAGPARSSNLRIQLMMIQALALLGRRDEALSLLLISLDHGLSPIDVAGAVDLKDLSNDPRYLATVAKLKATEAKPAS